MSESDKTLLKLYYMCRLTIIVVVLLCIVSATLLFTLGFYWLGAGAVMTFIVLLVEECNLAKMCCLAIAGESPYE